MQEFPDPFLSSLPSYTVSPVCQILRSDLSTTFQENHTSTDYGKMITSLGRHSIFINAAHHQISFSPLSFNSYISAGLYCPYGSQRLHYPIATFVPHLPHPVLVQLAF